MWARCRTQTDVARVGTTLEQLAEQMHARRPLGAQHVQGPLLLLVGDPNVGAGVDEDAVG